MRDDGRDWSGACAPRMPGLGMVDKRGRTEGGSGRLPLSRASESSMRGARGGLNLKHLSFVFVCIFGGGVWLGVSTRIDPDDLYDTWKRAGPASITPQKVLVRCPL